MNIEYVQWIECVSPAPPRRHFSDSVPNNLFWEIVAINNDDNSENASERTVSSDTSPLVPLQLL